MRKLFFAFLVSISAFAFTANASQEVDSTKSCQATVYLKDWRGGFSSLTDGFDWCFQIASNWKLDLSEGWKTRYCSSKTVYDNYGGITGYDFLFFHLDRSYSAKYSRSIFYAMDLDYSGRIHQGYESRIEVVFSPTCGENGGYDY